MSSAAFYLISAIILGGALAMITSRSLVRSVIWMVVSFVGVGALFLLLEAEFIAAVQILVYAGGIVVLFLFVVMLVNLDELQRVEYLHRQWLPAVLLICLLLAELGFMMWAGAGDTVVPLPDQDQLDAVLRSVRGGNVETIGMTLYTDYILPFEVVSVLLLVAMIGAIYLAKERV
ncbi:MAG: NADH-quinone oxidoreductase subunit J [Acidobacteria bacterium]|nr:NADH-quinone oxidoreductase subunit J [Acidobacteriota bacterium]